MPVLLPEAQKVPTKDRKLVVVGLTNLLTRSTKMLNEPHVRIWWVFILVHESVRTLLTFAFSISTLTGRQ